MVREYKTKIRLAGLPVVHMAVRSRRGEQPGVARGWIAVGDRAFARLIACGNVAVGPIAVGSFAVGGLSASIVSLGVFAVGPLVSVGVLAYGGVAAGLYAAAGGVAMAFRYSEGVVAIAGNANDAAAEHFFDTARPFALLHAFLDDWILVLAVTALLLVPYWLFLWKAR